MSDHSDMAMERMEKTLDSLRYNFARVRTGRANPHILDSIKVDYYGQPTPINQIAGVKVPEASMLTIEPWDRSSLNSIERAIRASDLGITPSNDGRIIRLPFPQPTEERRRELVRDCREYGEDARISVRNARKDANRAIDRDEELSEDMQTREKREIQKLTDEYIAEIDQMVKKKCDEVMEI